jgi:hypothetical protein
MLVIDMRHYYEHRMFCDLVWSSRPVSAPPVYTRDIQTESKVTRVWPYAPLQDKAFQCIIRPQHITSCVVFNIDYGLRNILLKCSLWTSFCSLIMASIYSWLCTHFPLILAFIRWALNYGGNFTQCSGKCLSVIRLYVIMWYNLN